MIDDESRHFSIYFFDVLFLHIVNFHLLRFAVARLGCGKPGRFLVGTVGHLAA